MLYNELAPGNYTVILKKPPANSEGIGFVEVCDVD